MCCSKHIIYVFFYVDFLNFDKIRNVQQYSHMIFLVLGVVKVLNYFEFQSMLSLEHLKEITKVQLINSSYVFHHVLYIYVYSA